MLHLLIEELLSATAVRRECERTVGPGLEMIHRHARGNDGSKFTARFGNASDAADDDDVSSDEACEKSFIYHLSLVGFL